jgi:flagellar motor switch protein FliM
MLTQAEIDALLSGTIETESGGKETNLAQLMGKQAAPLKGAASSREVKPYNFWSPERFSKDQMRAVELVHEELAERLSTSLPAFLRSNIRLRVVHTEQGRFHDFVNDLPPNCLYHIITLNPLPGQMVVTIGSDLNFVVLEQRLGGRGERNNKGRVLTEIDQSLLRSMVEHMLNDIKAAWSKVVAIEPGLEDSTINSNWVQMVMGNERVMLISFEITLQGVTGNMNIYIPFTTLKPAAGVLNPHVWITGRKEKQVDLAARKTAMEGLSLVSLPVRVFLGSSRLRVSEVAALELGDVIQLETENDEPLVVQVSGQPRFLARAGRVGKRLAATIETILPPSGVNS